MTNEILNIKDVAELLRLAEKTVYSMAQKGELPAFKIRGQWRIRRPRHLDRGAAPNIAKKVTAHA